MSSEFDSTKSADRDYSMRHGPLTDLFEQPRKPSDWSAYELEDTQIREFRERGYLSGVRVLDPEQVEVLRKELADIASNDYPRRDLFYEFHSNESVDPARTLFHALGAWRAEAGFHDLLWAPAFRMAAYQLLGGPVRQFHDQLFHKPAQDGGVVAWHQDYSYWTWTQPMQHLTCWIALDDVTAENGCLQYVPGSHRWGLLPITGLTGDMHAVDEVLTEEQREAMARSVPIELERGFATFHHPLLMHGSYENRSARERRAVVLNVVRDGVTSNPEVKEDADFGNFPVLPQGEPLAGRFYPLLFSPAEELGDSASSAQTIETLESGEL